MQMIRQQLINIIIIIDSKDSRMNQQSQIKKSNSCFKIHTCITQKYSNKFLFFMAKPINQIVYNEHKSIVNINVKDLFAFEDQSEYLNRIYRYFNSLGKQEIYDRIRLIGGFYSHNLASASYPTMIVTNTVKIFKTRERRMRKMIASDGSSDQSQIPTQNKHSFPSDGFFAQISSYNSSSSIASMFKSVQNQAEFDEQVHNIYSATTQIYQVASLKNMIKLEDEDISHLVCDFQEFDVQKTLADYQRIANKQVRAQKKMSLNSLSNKPVFKSIIINQKQNKNYRSTDKYHRLMSERNEAAIIKNQRQDFNRNYEMEMENPVLYSKSSRQKILRHLQARKQKPRIQQLTDRDWRRQRIRDKAAELLLRVKSQNYFDGRPDYLKY